MLGNESRDVGLAKLCRLISARPAADQPFHLVSGGSIGTPYETIASDWDTFLIGDTEDSALKVRRVLSECSSRPVDLEHMTSPKFFELMTALEVYRPALSAGLSPFNFGDLRFLVRALLGRIIIGDVAIQGELCKRQLNLREACAFYISSLFIMRYQDAYGLWRASRNEDLAIMAGELIQLASLLALLQTQLVDLAPKTAPSRAMSSDRPFLAQIASKLVSHLLQYDAQAPRQWGSELLALVNSTVAAGLLQSTVARSPWLDDAIFDPKICLMGIPGFLTAIDVLTNKVVLINEPYIASSVQRYLH